MLLSLVRTVPLPSLLTVKLYWGMTCSNFAVHFIFCASFTETVADEPAQSPAHCENLQPPAACAVSVSVELVGNAAEHFEPQSIPTGVEVITPSPIFSTTRFFKSGCPSNTAVHCLLLSSKKVVSKPIPEQFPCHRDVCGGRIYPHEHSGLGE